MGGGGQGNPRYGSIVLYLVLKLCDLCDNLTSLLSVNTALRIACVLEYIVDCLGLYSRVST